MLYILYKLPIYQPGIHLAISHDRDGKRGILYVSHAKLARWLSRYAVACSTAGVSSSVRRWRYNATGQREYSGEPASATFPQRWHKRYRPTGPGKRPGLELKPCHQHGIQWTCTLG